MLTYDKMSALSVGSQDQLDGMASPTYSTHIQQVIIASGKPVLVPTIEEEGFIWDIDGVKDAITSRTKAIMYCSPSNPTGTVFSEEQLRQLAEVALENDLMVITDEAYEYFTYNGHKHFSIASIPEMRKNDKYLSARNLMCKRLDTFDSVFEYQKPGGSYLMFPKILLEEGEDSATFCKKLLREARVSTTPGIAFGPTGEGHLRMSFCVPEEEINIAFDRMEAYFR